MQRDGRRIGHRPHPAPAEPRRFPDLHRDAGEHLLAPRFKLSAEIPSWPVAKSQQAVNQTVSGVRVRSKIVPAVTEVRLPHLEHMYRPSPSRQPVSRPQPEQAKPAGHRSHSR